MRSGIVANWDRNSFTCGITNAWIYIQYWRIFYVVSWGYDNVHSWYQFSSPVYTGFKLNSVPATAKTWRFKGNMLKVKFPADREHNTLLLWNKHCIFWVCTYSHKNVLTNQPNLCSTVQLQKQTFAQLVRIFPILQNPKFHYYVRPPHVSFLSQINKIKLSYS